MKKRYGVDFDIEHYIEVEAKDEFQAMEKARDRINEAEEGEAYNFRAKELKETYWTLCWKEGCETIIVDINDRKKFKALVDKYKKSDPENYNISDFILFLNDKGFKVEKVRGEKINF